MNETKEILNEAWEELVNSYFEKHPEEATKEFIRLYNGVKNRRKNAERHSEDSKGT